MEITRSNIKSVLKESKDVLTIVESSESFDNGAQHVFVGNDYCKALGSADEAIGFCEAYKMLGKGYHIISVSSPDWVQSINWGIDADFESLDKLLRSALGMKMKINLEVTEASDPWIPTPVEKPKTAEDLFPGVKFTTGGGVGVIEGDDIDDFLDGIKEFVDSFGEAEDDVVDSPNGEDASTEKEDEAGNVNGV